MIYNPEAIAALQTQVDTVCTLPGQPLKWQYLPLFLGFYAVGADGTHYNVKCGVRGSGRVLPNSWMVCAWPAGRPYLSVYVAPQPLADAWQNLNDRL